MKTEKVTQHLNIVLADTYTLYLKTQNYHWHVHGPHFKSLHILFEEQYTDLANAVDQIAERILTLGAKAPATFKSFLALTTLEEGKSDLSAHEMVLALANDQKQLIRTLQQTLLAAQDASDEGSITIIGERIAVHEKNHWMLSSSI